MRRGVNLRDPRYRREHPEPQQEAVQDIEGYIEDIRVYLEARNTMQGSSLAFAEAPSVATMRVWVDSLRQYRAIFELTRPAFDTEHAAIVEAGVPGYIRWTALRAADTVGDKALERIAARYNAGLDDEPEPEFEAEDAVIQQAGEGAKSHMAVNNPLPSEHTPEADPDLEALLEVL